MFKFKSTNDFFCFADGEMETLARIKSANTVRNYLTALNSLESFLHRRRLPLCNFNRQLMQDYEQWLLHGGLCRNTSSAYLRSLQSLFNRAVDQGLTPERNPFRRVFTGNEKTRKRTLKLREMKCLLATRPANHRLRLAADVCQFCFYVCGMPFVDVAHLRWSQISGGYLSYRRRKTGVAVTVRLQPEALAILRRYRDRDSEYVFPLMNNDNPKDYPLALARYNRALARLGRKVCVGRKLTSYVVRHSWASQSERVSMPDRVKGLGLGHTNVRTTSVYVASIGQGVLDRYNRRLLNTMHFEPSFGTAIRT